MFDLFVDSKDKDELIALIWMLECDNNIACLRKYTMLSHKANKTFIREYIGGVGVEGLRLDLSRFSSDKDWENIAIHLPTHYDPNFQIPINASEYQKLVLEKLTFAKLYLASYWVLCATR